MCFHTQRGCILLYIDDIIVMGPQRFSIDQVKSELMNHLEVKDLCRLRRFLGVTFIPDRDRAWSPQQ